MNVLRQLFAGKRKYIALAVLLVAAYFAVNRLRSRRGDAQVTLQRTTILRTVYGLGTVEAERSYSLKIGIAANISRLYVKAGDTVKKGDRLVEFDQVPVMTAPFAGVVSTVAFKEGEAVFPQNPVLQIMDLSRKYITVSLDEKSAVLIARDQKVRIAFEGLPGKTFAGAVSSIYPSNGQFMVKIESKELPREILPGMSADLAIEAGKKENVFVAPLRAVREGKVQVTRAGKKLRIPVQIGLTQGDAVEIVSSELAEGDILHYPQ